MKLTPVVLTRIAKEAGMRVVKTGGKADEGAVSVMADLVAPLKFPVNTMKR